MIQNLDSTSKQISLEPAVKIEQEINQMRDQLRNDLTHNIEKDKYDAKRDGLYKDIFHLCEKLGDHIVNVSEAITGGKEKTLKEELDEL